MNEQWAKLREWFDKLAPRERKLVAMLLFLLSAGVLLVVPVAVSMMLSNRAEANRAITEAIHRVKSSREEIDRRKAKKDAIVQRYVNRAPPLAGLLEKAATDNKLSIPESADRPEVPHGKKFSERMTVVRLRKVSMLPLSKMLEHIEQQKLPVSISRLSIRRRGGEPDSYDVELGLSAFDRQESKDTKSAGPSPATGGSK